MERIDSYGTLDYKLFHYLKNSDEFLPASCLGEIKQNYCSYDDNNTMGIVTKSRNYLPQRCWLLRCLRKPRRMFVGVIWINNKPRNATNDRWVLEFYGRKNLQMVQQLVVDLEKDFNTEITIKIRSDELKREFLKSDFDY